MLKQRRPHDLLGRRILVVEDDYFVADDLCGELEDQGAMVLGPVPTVTDALTLLALLAREDRPDMAVLDVKLGDEMVYPLADVLQDLEIPFVFATAYREQDLPQAYARLPRCEKPLDMGQLARALHEQVG